MTREQFTQFAQNEQKGLRRFLLASFRGNREEADDVAQEALLKAYMALSTFKDGTNFSTWLYHIAYNCLIDHYRKAANSILSLDIEQAHEVLSDLNSDNSFQYQDLYCAIDDLTPSERTAVLLFYMEDRSIKEISSIMSVAVGTVKSLLSRGREHLRNQLKEYKP